MDNKKYNRNLTKGRNILYILFGIGLLLVILPLLFLHLAYIYLSDVSQYWREVSYYVAVIAAIFAGSSVFIAWQSFQLARATKRPFISFTGQLTYHKAPNNYMALSFIIRNSGSMPGNEISLEIDPFYKNERITERNTSSKYTAIHHFVQTAIMFPNLNYEQVLYLDLNLPGNQALMARYSKWRCFIKNPHRLWI